MLFTTVLAACQLLVSGYFKAKINIVWSVTLYLEEHNISFSDPISIHVFTGMHVMLPPPLIGSQTKKNFFFEVKYLKMILMHLQK